LSKCKIMKDKMKDKMKDNWQNVDYKIWEKWEIDEDLWNIKW
jgi:hypothetical protein